MTASALAVRNLFVARGGRPVLRDISIRPQSHAGQFGPAARAASEIGRLQLSRWRQLQNRRAAQEIADAARDFEGALAVRVEDKRQGPPKLHDLPSLQKLCGSRFGWPASKTLEMAQELYDGQGKKIITYRRAEVRYLPQSLISDVPRIVAGLRVGQSFSTIPMPNPPIVRKGASGTFYDKGLEGASHHAVIPNVNTIDKLREVWPRLSSDEKKLFDVISRAYLAAPHARLPLPADNGNARRAWFRIPRFRSSTDRSRVARSFPGLAARRRKG
jgi:DNA topoisomerase-3